MSNISLAFVVSDPFGVNASNIFSELLTSDSIDEVKIRSLLQKSLKKKSGEILNSIRGFKLESD